MYRPPSANVEHNNDSLAVGVMYRPPSANVEHNNDSLVVCVMYRPPSANVEHNNDSLAVGVMYRPPQSFQVEGPQNREISLFKGNTIGRFFTGTFQSGKISQQQLLSCPAALTELQLKTLMPCKKCSHKNKLKTPITLRYEAIK